MDNERVASFLYRSFQWISIALIPGTMISYYFSIVHNSNLANYTQREIFFIIPIAFIVAFYLLRTAREPAIFSTLTTLGLVFGFINLIPHWVRMIDSIYDDMLFFPTCGTPTVRDYYLYVLDCLAKGAIIDLLDSFNINLYECAPAKGVFIVSMTTFLTRSLSTYVVVWIAITLLKAVWRARLRSAPQSDKAFPFRMSGS
jgi:hypothetical protein